MLFALPLLVVIGCRDGGAPPVIPVVAPVEGAEEGTAPVRPLRLLGNIEEVDAFALLDEGPRGRGVVTVRRARDLVPARVSFHDAGPPVVQRWEEPLPKLAGAPRGAVTVAAVGDVSEDGVDDFVIGRVSTRDGLPGHDRTATASLDGAFGRPVPRDDGPDFRWSLPSGERTKGIALLGPLDLGGDGSPDVLVTQLVSGDQAMAWYRGRRGEAGPVLESTPVVIGGAPGPSGGPAAAFGDLDGDGLDELVFGAPMLDSVSFHAGIPEGIRATPSRVVSPLGHPGFGRAVAVVGHHVLVVEGALPAGPWSGVWLGANGELGPPFPLCAELGPFAIAAVDATTPQARAAVACGTAKGVVLSELAESEVVGTRGLTLEASPPAAIELGSRAGLVGLRIAPIGDGPGVLWLFEAEASAGQPGSVTGGP
jgi:hypothetical protein